MKKISAVFIIIIVFTSNAWSFGSAKILGMNNEHSKITRAALSCDSAFDPLTKPEPCFSPQTMSNLGGEASGAFPAVESPDNLALHLSGGPDWWHCDKGDFLEGGGYPQTRDNATKKLLDCRQWAQRLLGDGLVSDANYCEIGPARTWLCSGVAARARFMLDNNSNVNVSQPGTFSLVSGCSFNGNTGRIKCEVLQQFGYALHAIQDFYSHSNYADINESWPLSWQSPPGIGSRSTPALWDMKNAQNSSSLLPDSRLSTGCYPDSGCISSSRTAHQYINKDKSDIDYITGVVTNPRTDRGKIVYGGVTNTQRAVEMAIRQTRAAWVDLQQLIIKKEGPARGAKIICAIASDDPNNCGKTSASGRLSPMSMPQGEIPEQTKIAPFGWMIKEFDAQGNDIHASKLGHLRSSTASRAEMVAGVSNPVQTLCGNMTVEASRAVPGLGKIVAYDLIVAGTNCKNASRLLHQNHKFFSHAGTTMQKTSSPVLQCITVTEDDDGATTHARIVCKNEDESIEMSFHPTCGGHDGDCGL